MATRQVKTSADTDCNARMMRRVYNATSWAIGKPSKRNVGNKERSENELKGFRKPMTRFPWRISVTYLAIAQDILRMDTDFLRRIIAPVDGMGGSYPVIHLLALQLLSSG